MNLTKMNRANFRSYIYDELTSVVFSLDTLIANLEESIEDNSAWAFNVGAVPYYKRLDNGREVLAKILNSLEDVAGGAQ